MNLLDGLKGYGTWFGPAHEKDCPADDTCECRGKPFNDAVNKIIAENRVIEDAAPAAPWKPGEITWFEVDGVWMARQSWAIVGKVWPAKDGVFYWQAAAWASAHANGKTGNGYAASVEEAKSRIKEICNDRTS